MISRRKFIKICASAIAGIGLSKIIFQSPLVNGAANRQIPVLVYHRVGYTKDYLTVTPEKLEADFKILQDQGYCTISLEQFQNFLDDRNIDMPDKPILITFDDGYLDNFQNAYPILKRRGMIATFFIITGMLWTDDRLSPERIVEMAQGGMSFGSHTVTHRPLGQMVWDDIKEELVNSKAELESVLGRTVNAIAYPQGSYNKNVIMIADNVGYKTGFTVHEGICVKTSPDFELRRIPIFKYDGDIASVIARRGGI
jgi:peptidoglycan/xylan/chitin deacetylase (PgdA/CDA1 family)